MNTQKVVFYRVNVRDLFPLNNPIVPHLLRLMAASDDLMSLHKLVMYASSREGTTSAEQEILRAENFYLFRLACGTLYEAVIVFQGLKSILDNANMRGMIDSLHTDAQDAFHALERLFRQSFTQSHWGKALVRIRNSVFHYASRRDVLRELEEYDEPGRLIIGQVYGATRLLVADDLQTRITMHALVDDQQQFEALDQLLMETTDYLKSFVGGMVALQLRLQRHAILEHCFDTVDLERLWGIL